MAEQIALIKLQIAPGKANPSPPVGPALGQHGLNIMEFCTAFNDATRDMDPAMTVPVEISVYDDRSFTWIQKQPPMAKLILKAAGLKSGSGVPNKEKVGTLTIAQVKEIAESKLPDLTAASIEAAMRTVAGTARSMGVEVEGEV